MNNSDNQKQFRRYALSVVLLITTLIIVLASIALQAYQTARKIENEFDALNYIQINLENSESEDETFNELVRLATIEISAIEQRALDYLGLFEAISIAITVLGVVGAIFGAYLGVGIREAENQFREAQDKMKEVGIHYQEINEKARQSSLGQFYFSLSLRQRAVGDLQGAVQTYQKAIELDSANPVPYYHKGYILTQIEAFEEAEESLKKSLELDGKFAHARAALGFLYRRKGDIAETGAVRNEYYKQAETHLKNALSASPTLIDDDGESWYGALAGLYRRKGQMDDAIYHYQQAAYITPRSSYPIVNLVMLKLRHGRPDNLRDELERSEDLIMRKIKKDADTYWDRSDLVVVQLALGKNEEALESLDAFLQVLPPMVADVLPRVRTSIADLLEVNSIEGVERSEEIIYQVLNGLDEEIKNRT